MKFFSFFICGLIFVATAQAHFLTPAQEKQTLTGIYWLLAGSYCWHKAIMQLTAACTTPFEYESLDMRKPTPDEQCTTYSDKELRASIPHEWIHLSKRHVAISIPLYLCIPFLAEGIVRSTLWLGNEAIKSVESWKVKLVCNAVHAACSWVAATGLPTCLLAMSLSSYIAHCDEYRANKQDEAELDALIPNKQSTDYYAQNTSA